MRSTKSRIVLTLVTVLAFIGSTTVPGLSLTTVGQITFKPIPAPARWRLLIGEYVLDNDTVIVLEKDGKLGILFKRTELNPLDQISKDKFQFPANSAHSADRVEFARDSHGKVTQVAIGKLIYRRKPLGPEEGSNQLRVEPLRPVPTLINEARTSQPPVEPGDFLPNGPG